MATPNGGPPQYLTPKEAAKVLRVDRRTIYTWLKSGQLTAVKYGGSWRIPKASVEATR